MSDEIQKREEQAITVPDDNALAAAFDGDKELNVPVGAVLPAVKILRESPKFEMPDGNVVESFRGHILHYHSVNQLYLNEYGADSEGQRPDCSSFDGLAPCNGHFENYIVDDKTWLKIIKQTNGPASLKDVSPSHPLAQVYLNRVIRDEEEIKKIEATIIQSERNMRSENCGLCPASQFGSKSIEDNNKACTNYIWLYILIDGYRLPVFMKAGPASLSRKDSLIPFLSNAPNIGLGGMYQTISIQFSLYTKSFNSGFNASSLKLSDPQVLDTSKQEDTERLLILMGMYKSFKAKYLESMQKFVAEDRGDDRKVVDAEKEAF